MLPDKPMKLASEINLQHALETVSRQSHPGGAYQGNRLQVIETIKRDGLVRPQFNVEFIKLVSASSNTLFFDDATLRSGYLAAMSDEIRAVAAVVCTIGHDLEKRASELTMGRKLSLAHAMDEVGNDLLLYLTRYALLWVRSEAARQGLKTGGSLSPGCNGLDISQQPMVSSMARADQLGISVSSGSMLYPVKSRSLLVPLGGNLRTPLARKRCESCSSAKMCRYRKC